MVDLSQPTTGQTIASLESSALIQRLDRRRTGAVGVINLPQFQSQYARIPGWLLQRQTILDQLRNRYGVLENSSGQEAALLLATSSPSSLLGSQTSMVSTVPPALGDQSQASSSVHRAKTNPASNAKFRVSRKIVPSISNSESSSPVVGNMQLSNSSTKSQDSSKTNTAESLGKEATISEPSTEKSMARTQMVKPQVASISATGEVDTPLLLKKTVTQGEDSRQVLPSISNSESPSPLSPNSKQNHTAESLGKETTISEPSTEPSIAKTEMVNPPVTSIWATAGVDPPLVLRKATTEQEDDSPTQSLMTAPDISKVDSSGSASRLNTSSNTEEESQGRTIIASSTFLPLPSASPPTGANTPLVLRKTITQGDDESSGEPTIASTRGKLVTNLARNSPTVVAKATSERKTGGNSSRAGISTALPLSKAQSISRLKRQLDSTLASYQQTSPEPTGFNHQKRVAREISVNNIALPGVNIVWRKGSSETVGGNLFSAPTNGSSHNSLPLAIQPTVQTEQIIARQTSTRDESTSVPGGFETPTSTPSPAMPMTATGSTSTQGINVGQIAEQVSRLICRQLIVERERRGMSK